jgi:hypothetical protein
MGMSASPTGLDKLSLPLEGEELKAQKSMAMTPNGTTSMWRSEKYRKYL